MASNSDSVSPLPLPRKRSCQTLDECNSTHRAEKGCAKDDGNISCSVRSSHSPSECHNSGASSLDGVIGDLKRPRKEELPESMDSSKALQKSTTHFSCDNSKQPSLLGQLSRETKIVSSSTEEAEVSATETEVDSGGSLQVTPHPPSLCDVLLPLYSRCEPNLLDSYVCYTASMSTDDRCSVLDSFVNNMLKQPDKTPSGPVSSTASTPAAVCTTDTVQVHECRDACEDASLCSFLGRDVHSLCCTDQLHPELPVNTASVNCPWKECTGEGIHHGVYPSDSLPPDEAAPLLQYKISISPVVNLEGSTITQLVLDDKSFVFDGFSILSRFPLHDLPQCSLKRFGHCHQVNLVYEGTVGDKNVDCLSRELLTLQEFIFVELLELYDWVRSLQAVRRTLYCTPRFMWVGPDKEKIVLSPVDTMRALLQTWSPLSPTFHTVSSSKEMYSDLLLLCPGKVPRCLRVDRIQRESSTEQSTVVHFCTKRAQSSFVGNKEYQSLLDQYIKLKRDSIKGTLKKKDYFRFSELKHKLRQLRSSKSLKREVVTELPNIGFLNTGLRADVARYGLMVPVVVHHVRFYLSLPVLERTIGYSFKDKSLLKLALTHPSYDLKYGTTSDHVRNSLTNCGIKRPQVMFERSQLQGKSSEQVNTESSTMQPLHNERLEFLGDAIIEYLTTTHLFHMFPKHTEGQLSSHRMALVQNSNLCCVAKRLRLQDYLLIQHESDLSNDILDHELANCFEALIGSIYQDGGLEACDCVLGGALFTEEPLRMVWNSFPPHPLQCEHLDGDRFMIEQSEHLQKLTLLEEAIGVQFRNVRILAKAFTHSSIENNDITRGHNQRLEFFGDAILQFVTSCHLYNAYPQHHEGRLTLMRSSIVSNDTLSKVASSLGLQEYVLVDDKQNVPINGKLLADLTEALSAAILLDKGLPYVWTFCQVCLLPNLKPPGQEDQVPQVTPTDPKSQLLRKLIQEQRRKGLSRELPFYRVIGRKGPSHNPVFTAGVYCGGRLLAKGDGRSINSAEQKAAQKATTHLEEKR